MTAPQNVIIKESGPFYDQPQWVEDYYQTAVADGASNHTRFAYGPVTNHLRYRHQFPNSAAGVVLTFSDPYEVEKGRISGFILDAEEYERFTQFVRSGFHQPDKNNFVLIDDLVATIVHNNIFNDEQMTLDSLYDIVRQAVYQARPHSGPDDVWVDAIVDTLYDEDIIPQDRPRAQVERLFRNTFQSYVYGYAPKPEPTTSFIQAFQAELEAQGYTTRNAAYLAATAGEVASREPCSPWLQEPVKSPLRDAQETISTIKKELYELSYISRQALTSPQLDKLLHRLIFGRKS